MHRGIAYQIIGFFLLFLWVCKPQSVLAQAVLPTPDPGFPLATTLPQAGPPAPAAGGFSEPKDGSNLRGSVRISGFAAGAWSLSFSYVQNSGETWFPLAQSNSPIAGGNFANWNTANLTDGLYNLKLSVSTSSGNQEFVLKVRVNNYTFVETDTPTPTLTLLPTSTPTSTPTLQPTREITTTVSPTIIPSSTETSTFIPPAENVTAEIATLVPSTRAAPRTPAPNPAALASKDILFSLGKGFFIVLFAFFAIALVSYLRKK